MSTTRRTTTIRRPSDPKRSRAAKAKTIELRALRAAKYGRAA